jgi:hypothetical protein
MAQPRRGPGLAAETLAVKGGLRSLRREHLDGHEAVEPGLLGEVDGAHAAPPDLPQDPEVGPERLIEQLPQAIRDGHLRLHPFAAVGAEPSPVDQRSAAGSAGHGCSSKLPAHSTGAGCRQGFPCVGLLRPVPAAV